MALLSTSSHLVKVSENYSAGSGISIDNNVISVTGEFGKVYSAGKNISITDEDVINSKDWTNDIANASANAYNAATALIGDKLDSTAFTTWQNGQYSTDLQTIEGQIANKLDTSSFSDVSASFLTAHQSLDGYATTAQVDTVSSLLSAGLDYVSAHGGASYTGDAQGALDKVYSNSGNWISTLDNAASALFFANNVQQGNVTYGGPILSAKSTNWNFTNSFEIVGNKLTLASDFGNGRYSGSFNPTGLSGYGTGNWGAGNFDWHLDYRGLGGKFSDLDNTTSTWSALRNVDLGLTTAGVVSSISGHQILPYPMEFVSTSSEATGTNILYIVTGTGV